MLSIGESGGDGKELLVLVLLSVEMGDTDRFE